MFENLIGHKREIFWVLQFWPVLLTSFVTAVVSTWICKKVALKFGIVDKPDALVKTHKEPIAYLGGVAILVGLIFGTFCGIVLVAKFPEVKQIVKWLFAILAGGTIACFIGLVDDIFEITPNQKFLGQIFAALLLIVVGILPNLEFIKQIVGFELPPVPDFIISSLIVIFFVLGATNSLNLLDGLDGLCAGVTAIIILAMLFLATHLATWYFSPVGDPVRIIICLGILGGVCGFLPFNRHPAKIFMGDAGSMLLGFITASLMILFAEKIPRWWLASIVVFGLPILDTAVALLRRLINKRPLFVSDRGHIYDQMIDRGIPLKRTVLISYLLAAMYALIGILMSQIRTIHAGIVYLLVFIISGLVVWKKGYLKMEGIRGAVRKED